MDDIAAWCLVLLITAGWTLAAAAVYEFWPRRNTRPGFHSVMVMWPIDLAVLVLATIGTAIHRRLNPPERVPGARVVKR